MDTKQCRHCRAIKPIAEFPRSATSRDGYYNDCITCRERLAKPWAKRPGTSRAGRVYLVKADNGLFKIGFTTNLKKRLIGIKLASPVNVSLLASKKSPRGNLIEHELHSRYSEFHSHGEWYRLPESAAIEILKRLE